VEPSLSTQIQQPSTPKVSTQTQHPSTPSVSTPSASTQTQHPSTPSISTPSASTQTQTTIQPNLSMQPQQQTQEIVVYQPPQEDESESESDESSSESSSGSSDGAYNILTKNVSPSKKIKAYSKKFGVEIPHAAVLYDADVKEKRRQEDIALKQTEMGMKAVEMMQTNHHHNQNHQQAENHHNQNHQQAENHHDQNHQQADDHHNDKMEFKIKESQEKEGNELDIRMTKKCTKASIFGTVLFIFTMASYHKAMFFQDHCSYVAAYSVSNYFSLLSSFSEGFHCIMADIQIFLVAIFALMALAFVSWKFPPEVLYLVAGFFVYVAVGEALVSTANIVALFMIGIFIVAPWLRVYYKSQNFRLLLKRSKTSQERANLLELYEEEMNQLFKQQFIFVFFGLVCLFIFFEKASVWTGLSVASW
jgi:hypothetical protein